MPKELLTWSASSGRYEIVSSSFLNTDIFTISATASGALAALDLVYYEDVSGTLTAYKADANNNRPAMGIVLSAAASSATAVVYQGRTVLSGFTGLTPNSLYYLSDTGTGTWSTTPPSRATGRLVQIIGRALSATTFELFAYNQQNVLRYS